jgi:MFS family permease
MKFFRNMRFGHISLWCAAIAIAVFVAFFSVWWGAVNQDEGWYLYAARLVKEGKLPYSDFFFTQGPALPFVYSVLPIEGMLSGRIVTFCFSLLATVFAIAFARRLVVPERRTLVSITVFSMLMCNLYHVYFTSIPKTYALGAVFTMAGFLLLSKGWNFSAAMAMAFASGTRISLVLILGVVGTYLLTTRFRDFSWLKFGIGGTVGLTLMYGFFAMDRASLNGLLAAQAYHAGRGGFDPFFVAGSVSRLARGYLSLGAVMFAALLFRCRDEEPQRASVPGARALLWMAGLSFMAVFLLQMSAPFPYDDYEVPIMPLLAVIISIAFVNASSRFAVAGYFPVMVAGMCAFASPMLQDWMTNGNDRFWTIKKDCSEISQIRQTARKIEQLDPGGTLLLTQDIYLAVESGRKVPEGLEMGPFSYFPNMSDQEAASIHVVNRSIMSDLLAGAPCKVAAFSGYGFAIESPKGARTSQADVNRFGKLLQERYRLAESVENFGQHHTRLDIFVRKDDVK